MELEEMANAVTHGVGLIAAIAALPALIVLASNRGDVWTVVGAGVFGVSLIAAYAASTIYHALRPGPEKERWLRLDYAAIYILIAGTYTPFTVGVLRGAWGSSLLVIVWTLAIVGIFAKLRVGPRFNGLSTAAYLLMGWLALVAINPLLRHMGWVGLAWLLAGGVAYTVGVVFYACDNRIRFGHCLWHLFAIVGSLCHVIAVVGYGIGAPRG
jgi:hemolysin III